MLGPDGETVVYISNATNLVFPVIAAGAGLQAYATIMTDAPTGFTGLVSGTPERPQGASDVSVGGGAGALIRFGFTSDSGQLSGPNPFGLSRAYTLLFDGTSSPQLLDRGSGSAGAQGDQDSGAPDDQRRWLDGGVRQPLAQPRSGWRHRLRTRVRAAAGHG